MLERGNLTAALRRVEANGGAPGIDGMTVEELRPYLKEHWLEIRESFQQAVALQQVVAQVLTPQFERGFSSHSYGFRPGRGAHDAIKETQGYIREGYTWVVDMDKFLDRINHDKIR